MGGEPRQSGAPSVPSAAEFEAMAQANDPAWRASVGMLDPHDEVGRVTAPGLSAPDAELDTWECDECGRQVDWLYGSCDVCYPEKKNEQRCPKCHNREPAVLSCDCEDGFIDVGVVAGQRATARPEDAPHPVVGGGASASLAAAGHDVAADTGCGLRWGGGYKVCTDGHRCGFCEGERHTCKCGSSLHQVWSESSPGSAPAAEVRALHGFLQDIAATVGLGPDIESYDDVCRAVEKLAAAGSAGHDHVAAYRQMEAERAERLRTNGGGNREDHGPTCAETPLDHRCGDTESDQGVTWSEWVHTLNERIQRIRGFHVNVEVDGGAVTGYCAECQQPYPCQTAHIANGWDDGENDCYATGWCHHAGVKVEKLYDQPTDEELLSDGSQGHDR